MSRLLSHVLLLLYAGVYLHCQPLGMRAQGSEPGTGTRQEQPRAGLCKKKLQTVQADPQADHAQVVKAKLLPLGSDFSARYCGLLFPADEPALNPARGPNAGPEQSFANHPNKAPPVRFS